MILLQKPIREWQCFEEGVAKKPFSPIIKSVRYKRDWDYSGSSSDDSVARVDFDGSSFEINAILECSQDKSTSLQPIVRLRGPQMLIPKLSKIEMSGYSYRFAGCSLAFTMGLELWLYQRGTVTATTLLTASYDGSGSTEQTTYRRKKTIPANWSVPYQRGELSYAELYFWLRMNKTAISPARDESVWHRVRINGLKLLF